MERNWQNHKHFALSVEQLLAPGSKKNAGRNLIDGFSTALNSLTDTVISKNKTNTLLAASYLYAYIPDFYSLYRAETSPEIKRVRYYTRNAMLNAMTANWEQADSDMSNLKNVWNLYKILYRKNKENFPANWIIPYRSSKRFCLKRTSRCVT